MPRCPNKIVRWASMLVLANFIVACDDGFKTAPFQVSTAHVYGTISSTLVAGPPFRFTLESRTADCTKWLGENSGQTNGSGGYNLLLPAFSSTSATLCLRATIHSAVGADSAMVLIRGIRFAEGEVSPPDSQRVDVALP